MLFSAVRDYHRTYYVPHNLTLIVAGKLASGTTSLLDVVQNTIEPRIIAHGQNKGPRPAGWKRPFLETASAQRAPIAKTIKETVHFPEKDESQGEIQITYLGPPPTAYLERNALDLLSLYLTSSSVAPLTKEYVEIEKPLWCVAVILVIYMCLSDGVFCSTYIDFSQEERATAINLSVYCPSVPTQHLDTFDDRLKASLTRIADEGLDMKRMAMVIDRDERQV